ncbi:hypothetical protein [Actinomadura rudentiformis]|uniref:Enoyl-CoA hydratase/isomerase family protein n=1 Tax=Actinomadura rudentiformis TaxID=359158 RepID=A0A6H9YGK4_9ACTN|nr:hypothetical protein [Actinomadura rudentiformis]KAB2345475.1 enoyl-CoA hydratase/isomerase family protein [Actinomadura rudentiformis]
MAENVKRVTVTLPLEQVERIKAVIARNPDVYPTVSSFVVEAISDRIDSYDAHEMLVDVLREIGGEPDEDAKEWAAEAMKVMREMAAERRPGPTAKGAA